MYENKFYKTNWKILSISEILVLILKRRLILKISLPTLLSLNFTILRLHGTAALFYEMILFFFFLVQITYIYLIILNKITINVSYLLENNLTLVTDT